MVTNSGGAAFSALADPTRPAVLGLLRHGSQSAGRIAGAFPISRPAISKHLRVLRYAYLVEERREGRHRLEADLRPRGGWRSERETPDGSAYEMMGGYLEVQPPHLLVYTWVATWTGDVQTALRLELEYTNGGTPVRIRHSGFAAHPEIANSYRGWPRMLEWLRSFIESGETVASRKPATRS